MQDNASATVSRHSGLGISSFVLAIGSCVLTLALFVVAGVAGPADGEIDEKSPLAMALGLGVFALLFLMMLGTGLGIGGVCQKGRKKTFAILGIVFSGIGLLVLVGLIAVGLAMG